MMSDALARGSGLIFVVDDETLIQQTTKMILEECGYQVMQAENGIQALELFEKHCSEIKCTILDISLPDMSGTDIYDEMKKIDSDLKVIISSGRTKDTTVEDLLEAGADMFLAKPFSVIELADDVAKLIVKGTDV